MGRILWQRVGRSVTDKPSSCRSRGIGATGQVTSVLRIGRQPGVQREKSPTPYHGPRPTTKAFFRLLRTGGPRADSFTVSDRQELGKSNQSTQENATRILVSNEEYAKFAGLDLETS